MTPQEMKGLWDLLAQTWGSKFYEQYGTEPNDAWTMTLANTSRDAAMYSMKKLIEGGSPFAPTLPEFMVFSRKWDRDNGPRYDSRGNVISLDDARAIADGFSHPSPAADPEKTRKNLQRLRDLLNS